MKAKHIECSTADGQLLSLKCPEDATEDVRAVLAKVTSMRIPTTYQANVSHGGYRRYSRFSITQHNYAGGRYPGNGGYVESLEIVDPPDDRCGFVLHRFINDYHRYGSTFWEFETLDDLSAAWDCSWRSMDNGDGIIIGIKGCKRKVECGGLTPWFYAIGDQALFGEFAYPNHVSNDPVYRPFQRFVVYDSGGFPSVKVCMGCVRVTGEASEYGRGYQVIKKKEFRVVYWDDGTVFDERSSSCDRVPLPLREKDPFTQEAVDRFKECLSGKERKFEILLSNGTMFLGRFLPAERGTHTASGEYYAQVILEDGTAKAGVFEFKPTCECPTIERFLESRGIRKILKLEYRRKGSGRKKWSGVFPAP